MTLFVVHLTRLSVAETRYHRVTMISELLTGECVEGNGRGPI
jgi:hypothetical protein